MFLTFWQMMHFCLVWLPGRGAGYGRSRGTCRCLGILLPTENWGQILFPKTWLCKKHVTLTRWLSGIQCSRLLRLSPHWGRQFSDWCMFLLHNLIRVQKKTKKNVWALQQRQPNLGSMANLSHWAATNKAWWARFWNERNLVRHMQIFSFYSSEWRTPFLFVDRGSNVSLS